MKVVSFGTLKGGTGKTMMSVSIAGILAEKKKVLVIDADPQCNATTNLGVSNTDLERSCIIDLFSSPDIKPETVILKSVIVELPNLDLIPSNILLTETEQNLFMRANREWLLRNWIENNSDYLKQYSHIIIDTNPSMGLINKNAFAVSDSIILVSDVGQNSIQGAEVFIWLWGKVRKDLNLKDNVTALIINNSDKRIKLAREIEDYCRQDETIKNLFVSPVIPARVASKNAEGEMKPISIANPNSDVVEIFRKLVVSLQKKGAL